MLPRVTTEYLSFKKMSSCQLIWWSHSEKKNFFFLTGPLLYHIIFRNSFWGMSNFQNFFIKFSNCFLKWVENNCSRITFLLKRVENHYFLLTSFFKESRKTSLSIYFSLFYVKRQELVKRSVLVCLFFLVEAEAEAQI